MATSNDGTNTPPLPLNFMCFKAEYWTYTYIYIISYGLKMGVALTLPYQYEVCHLCQFFVSLLEDYLPTLSESWLFG